MTNETGRIKAAFGVDLASGRIDPISRLPNRHQFTADQIYWTRENATLVLVTLADARGFNAILRALGHACAEAFIRAGAHRLHSILGRSTKLYNVSILSFVFRLPGNVAPCRHPIIDQIIAGFREPLLVEGVPIDAEIGVGLKASRGPGAAEDLRAALSAAQESRGAPARWAWYDENSDALHVRAFRLLSDLKTALEAPDQLHLAFQPKVSLADGTCASAEALVRWRHPTFGAVSPGEFIPLAETTALVQPLTRWVISAAVEHLAAWRDAGLGMRLAVNVSPKNLEEPDFVEYLLFCCAMRGIERSSIEVEVTEGVDAAQGRLILDRLAALRALGFRIAIDDFGSGYSNMSYLTRLSAHTLKIDQSLVRGATPDNQSGRLLASVVAMGHDLGYEIVAEGVETEVERAMLVDMGCDYGQGYLFARPMSGCDLMAWCAAAARRRSA